MINFYFHYLLGVVPWVLIVLVHLRSGVRVGTWPQRLQLLGALCVCATAVVGLGEAMLRQPITLPAGQRALVIRLSDLTIWLQCASAAGTALFAVGYAYERFAPWAATPSTE
jgi:hypothetical protein